MQSETLAQEFARLVKEYHEGDDRTKPEAWNLLADYAVDNADAISAALSDKQAGETFTREQMLAEVERRVERALAARSALVDVPAVEPAAWRWESAYGGEDLIGQWQVSTVKPSRSEDATDFICEPLYTSPPLSREGEDSAEVVTLTRAEADRIAQRLEFDASWDKCGDGYYSIKRQLGTLAATRSGSAISQKGCADE